MWIARALEPLLYILPHGNASPHIKVEIVCRLEGLGCKQIKRGEREVSDNPKFLFEGHKLGFAFPLRT